MSRKRGESIAFSRLPKLIYSGLILVILFAIGSPLVSAQNPVCNRVIKADVVAFDQVYTYNRFGAYNPAGMIYALLRDVAPIDSSQPIGPGNVQLRTDKRPRPLVLRANEGDCLQVNFTNWLDPNPASLEGRRPASTPARQPYFDKSPFFIPREGQTSYDESQAKLRTNPDGTVAVIGEDGQVIQDGKVDMSKDDTTATRYASMHVNGLEYVNGIASDGANVGKNDSSLVAPGQTRTYAWYAKKQGQYLVHSMGAPSGGEGDGGQTVLGLFGSINVEPKNSKWYRSQVTAAQLQKSSGGAVNPNGTPRINFDSIDTATGLPVLNMLNSANEIIYTDLNAVITDPDGVLDEDCSKAPKESGTCGKPFREFTVIFHDELKAVQAFPELNQELFHGVKDGFAINYGASGLGSLLVANRKKVGPAADCEDCKFEEFFLESWVNGDPAMVVRQDPVTKKAVEALFPDDPSNVHHSYLGEPVRFRNLHVGPKETHVFHLHAHQWLHESREDGSTYLDSQTVSPGSTFTYEINYGGSGNRNFTAGDSIFHCHLYPHFAQGMWELWRVHDTFEAGTPDRNLPDAEITAGTPNPAIIPVPYVTLQGPTGTTVGNLGTPPMPNANFKGYPFWVAGEKGKRPPQPPLDFALNAAGQPMDGGLPRHLILNATITDGRPGIEPAWLNDPVASRVLSLNQDPNLLAFARKLEKAELKLLPNGGTAEEQTAMNFHAGNGPGMTSTAVTTRYGWPAKAYQTYTATGAPGLFLVNGLPAKAGAPFADPCKPGIVERKYKTVYTQFDMKVNAAGWHDRQARIMLLENDVNTDGTPKGAPEPLFFRANSDDCIVFSATNLIPNILNLDDFQIFTPTDIMGQHIHLVKFDVTSSDGAGNGWNYEDGTFSSLEVQERIKAHNAYQASIGGTSRLTAVTNPKFLAGPDRNGDGVGDFIGAQTTVQRWWADPLLKNDGTDRTIRTVFTHDHFGPSSHQHHGFYGALVVEKKASSWTMVDGTAMATRDDGGPTSFKANVEGPDSYREFNLAFADFAIVYTPNNLPINPPGRKEAPLPDVVQLPDFPQPEAISAADPGTELINYRNEPIPTRISVDGIRRLQYPAGDPRGDLANVFRSKDEAGNTIHGDPYTPLLEAFEGDKVQVRLIQGAQEEQHVFSLHAGRWLHEPSALDSGHYNAQALGISEHFEFVMPPLPQVGNVRGGNKDMADFLYGSLATDNLWNGMWGLMREYKGKLTKPDLKPLNSNPEGKHNDSDPGLRSDFCPSGANQVQFQVEAWLASDLVGADGIVYNNRLGLKDPAGIVFVESADVAAIRSGAKKLEPLVLRANAGDCVNVKLTNNLPATLPDYNGWNFMPMLYPGFNLNQVRPSNQVSLHPQLLEYDVRTSDGANVGNNDLQTAAPGQNQQYRWYAGKVSISATGARTATPVEFGAVNLTDYGDIMKHGSHGAGAVLIIEPKGATWTFPDTRTEAIADVTVPATTVGGVTTPSYNFREFTVVYQDDVNMQGPNGNPVRNLGDFEDNEDSGMKGFNYKTEPIWGRLRALDGTSLVDEMTKLNPSTFNDVVHLLNEVDQKNVLSSKDPNTGCNGPAGECGDPATPLFTVVAGEKVRFRVVQPTGHQRQHGYTIYGHNWFHEPWVKESTTIWRPGIDADVDSMTIGTQGGHTARRAWNIVLPSAGGSFKTPGDYLYRTQESFQFTNGLWGIFRVLAVSSPINLTATTVSSTQVDLAWTDTASNESGFRVERIGNGISTFTTVANIGPNVTSYSDTNLVAGKSYSYRVQAWNAAGNSEYSNIASANTLTPPPATLPGAPTALMAATGISSASLKWTDNATNEVGFKLERKVGLNGTWTEIATIGPNITTYNNTGLTTGTTYSYRVRAYNSAGNSAYSNVVTFTK